MTEQAKRELLAELLGIAAQATGDPLTPFYRGMSWGDGDRRFTLPELAAYAFLALAGRLARERPWSDRFSEEYIRDRLVPILRSAREDGAEAAGRLLDGLVDDLETYAVERTAYVPVQALSLALGELGIGRVVFRTVDDGVLDDLRGQVEAIYAGPDGDARDRAYVGTLLEDIAAKLGGKVCAVFRAVAEPTRAREQAEVEARRALEVITFANAALHPFHYQADAVVGLEGEVPTVGPWIGVAADDLFYHSLRAAPTSWPIEITRPSIERLQEVGALALSDLLARPADQLTDLEQALLRAVHWFAASQAQVELENRLLNLTTCLEALVGPEDGTRIAATVSERTALIVARGEHRVGVRRFVRELYRARSGVSHGGAKTVSEADVKELRRVAAELIATLLRRRERVRTKAELLACLNY